MTVTTIIAVLTFLAVFGVMVGVVHMLGAADRKRDRDIGERLKGLEMAARRRKGDDESINLLRDELEGSMPVIDRLFRSLNMFPGIEKLLSQSQVGWTPADLLLRSAAVAMIGLLIAYWRTNYWLFSLAFGALVSAGPLVYVMYRRTRRLQEFERQLPGALELMTRALRAGHGLVAGLEMVARETPNPVGREFEITFDEQNYGLELRDALKNLIERVPVQDVRIVVTAILIQRDTGGNLAEVLENTSKVIRERYRLKRQIRVHTAQGRLTGWILSMLPVVLGVGMFLFKPDFISVLWQDERGISMLWTAAGLTLLGALLIRKIIQIRV